MRYLQEAFYIVGMDRLSPFGKDVLYRAGTQLMSESWCDTETSDDMRDVETSADTELALDGYYVQWDGGFSIMRDCGSDECQERDY
jgi:hypothetical protein